MNRSTEFPSAAYIHIPFCLSKCIYCDFNSYPGMSDLFDPYVNALLQEINISGSAKNLDTVFFGGGTPTVLGPARLALLLDALRNRFGFCDGCEITVEANPGTIDVDSLKELFNAGFNRISIGVQSFNDRFLRKLERIHNGEDAIHAVNDAREAGFTNISLDLMYALPCQTLEDWTDELLKAVDLQPEHISAYELTIEPGTRLAEMVESDEIVTVNEELQIEMLRKTSGILAENGYSRYEVSNYCRQGYECRHNVIYWKNQPYWGFGAGAVSYVNGKRSSRIPVPDQYIKKVMSGETAVISEEKLSGRTVESETLMMGLRMVKGISIDVIESMSNESQDQIARLTSEGLLQYGDGYIRATNESMLKLNDIIVALMP